MSIHERHPRLARSHIRSAIWFPLVAFTLAAAVMIGEGLSDLESLRGWALLAGAAFLLWLVVDLYLAREWARRAGGIVAGLVFLASIALWVVGFVADREQGRSLFTLYAGSVFAMLMWGALAAYLLSPATAKVFRRARSAHSLPPPGLRSAPGDPEGDGGQDQRSS